MIKMECREAFFICKQRLSRRGEMMSQSLKRTIRTAYFKDEIGVLSVDDLMAMPSDKWGVLRDRISDVHTKKGEYLAVCARCGHGVYIVAVPSAEGTHPCFRHFSGASPNCEWFTSSSQSPDAIRAKQYQGKQESAEHRLLCEKLAELISLDKRCQSCKVDEYRRQKSELNSFGRYPDIQAVWKDFGEFAIEVQLSNTQQTEISQRGIHYAQEGVPLLWVLGDFDLREKLPQCFVDIIRRHRGNAFVLDHEACRASYEYKTLFLKVHMFLNEELVESKLVRIDELKIPDSMMPYHTDMLSEAIRNECDAKRLKWFKELKPFVKQRLTNEDLKSIKSTLNFSGSITSCWLIAATFSIVSAANGHWRNYANAMAEIRSMMNALLLYKKEIKPYALLLKDFILRTTSGDEYFISGKGAEIISKVSSEVEQAGESDSNWLVVQELFPELYDPIIREELKYLSSLPHWVVLEDVA